MAWHCLCLCECIRTYPIAGYVRKRTVIGAPDPYDSAWTPDIHHRLDMPI